MVPGSIASRKTQREVWVLQETASLSASNWILPAVETIARERFVDRIRQILRFAPQQASGL
jgi:hypothetical protein